MVPLSVDFQFECFISVYQRSLAVPRSLGLRTVTLGIISNQLLQFAFPILHFAFF